MKTVKFSLNELMSELMNLLLRKCIFMIAIKY